METFWQQISNKAVWIMLIAVFAMGVLADHYVLSPAPKYGRDTTYVQLPAPPPSMSTAIPAKPVVIYRDRVVPDSSALWQSAWLQNENATLKDSLDSLMDQKDSLRQRLEVLLAPHTATSPFHFDFANKGYMDGTAQIGYAPMSQQFGLTLTPTRVVIPEITLTKRPAWWVKPTLFLGGAGTVYFVTEKNSTGALIAAGVSTILLLVEF